MQKKLLFFLLIFLCIFPFASADLVIPFSPPITPVLGFLYTREPFWPITAFIIDFIVDSFLLAVFMMLFLGKDYLQKNLKLFFKTAILITIAGAIADAIGVTFLFLLGFTSIFLVSIAPSILIVFLLFGFLLTIFLIGIFDYLILTNYTKLSKSNAGTIASLLAILTNPFLLWIVLTIIFSLAPKPSSYSDLSFPIGATSYKLKDAATKLAQHYKTDIVEFNSGYIMDAKTIITTAEVGLDEDQLCLSLGDFSDEAGLWEVGNNHEYIKYKGNEPKDVKISIVCDVGEHLNEAVEAFGEAGILNPDWLDGCGCIGSDDICCLIALRDSNA